MPATLQYCLGLVALAGLAACANTDEPHSYLRRFDAIPESTTRFTVCSLAGCEETADIHVSPADWKRLEAIFFPTPGNGHQERERVAAAIAAFERLTGQQAATFDDQPAGQGIFRTTRQLDCVAETANTTIYLLALQQRGLMRRYTVAYPQHRGFLQLQAPHNTAVIVDRGTQQRFAVDAYYHANGEAPEIVPLDVWSAGYRPAHRSARSH